MSGYSQLHALTIGEKTCMRPSTPTIAEDEELQTNADETTSLLDQHHQKFDQKYTEDGFIIDNDDEAEFEAPNFPVDPFSLRVRKHRSTSQLSLVDEEMDEFNKQKRGSFFVHFELSEKSKKYLEYFKVALLFAMFLVVVVMLHSINFQKSAEIKEIWRQTIVDEGGVFFSIHEEYEDEQDVLAISNTMPYYMNLTHLGHAPIAKVDITGPFNKEFDKQSENNMSFTLVYHTAEEDFVPIATTYLPLLDDLPSVNTGDWIEYSTRLDLPDTGDAEVSYGMLFESSVPELVTFGFSYHPQPSSSDVAVLIGFIILIMVYVLIGFELIHRTVAAMIGAFAVLAVQSAFNQRPTLEGVMEMVDYETLALLWGMMTIVAIFSETGFFEWCALQSYKIAKGQIWTLITLLCIFAGVVSAFLDNVTTILLLTPVTISLCEVLQLDPRHVLIAEVLFSNIGGTATAVGDPPNVIIISNSEVQKAGITFTKFTLHMSIGIVFCMFAGYFLLRLLYRKRKLEQQDPPAIRAMKQEIEVWRRSASRIMVVSREESTVKALLMQKVYQLENTLNNLQYEQRNTEKNTDDWKDQYAEMRSKYHITNKTLLIKCGCVLTVTITMFFMSSFLNNIYLNIGWIAVIAALVLLIISDIHDFEAIMHRVEWATLLFFAALFILMEGLTELGLIDYIGTAVAELIKDVQEESRLTVAIILILWVSALASSFIDNIPFTTAMVPIIISLSENSELGLPLEPMVWALAFGACLGGNGTLIGASANVVCAGIAQQHGYPFSFIEFTKVGFPMMLGTTFVAMIYLLICHSWLGWNS